MATLRIIPVTLLVAILAPAQQASPPPPDHPEVYDTYFRGLAELSGQIRAKEAVGRPSTARNQAAASFVGLRQSDLARARDIAEKVVRDLDDNTKARQDARARNPRLTPNEEKRFTANRQFLLSAGIRELQKLVGPAQWPAVHAYINSTHRAKLRMVTPSPRK